MEKDEITINSGKVLRRLRKMNKCNQEELAEVMKLPRASISDIETGKRAMSIRHLYLICQKFGVDPSIFFPNTKIKSKSVYATVKKKSLVIAKNRTY